MNSRNPCTGKCDWTGVVESTQPTTGNVERYPMCKACGSFVVGSAALSAPERIEYLESKVESFEADQPFHEAQAAKIKRLEDALRDEKATSARLLADIQEYRMQAIADTGQLQEALIAKANAEHQASLAWSPVEFADPDTPVLVGNPDSGTLPVIAWKIEDLWYPYDLSDPLPLDPQPTIYMEWPSMKRKTK